MAETATKTNTPRTARAPRKPAASRTTAAKAKTTATEAPPAEEVAAATPQTLTFSLAQLGDTKNYSTFDISQDVNGNATGCVGKFYAPLGTQVVKIRVEGPMDGVSE